MNTKNIKSLPDSHQRLIRRALECANEPYSQIAISDRDGKGLGIWAPPSGCDLYTVTSDKDGKKSVTMGDGTLIEVIQDQTNITRDQLTPAQASVAKDRFYADRQAQSLMDKIIRLESNTAPAIVLGGSGVEVEHKFKSASVAVLRDLAIAELQKIWQEKLNEAAKV